MARRSSRKRRRRRFLIGLLTIGAGGLAVWFWTGHGPAEPGAGDDETPFPLSSIRQTNAGGPKTLDSTLIQKEQPVTDRLETGHAPLALKRLGSSEKAGPSKISIPDGPQTNKKTPLVVKPPMPPGTTQPAIAPNAVTAKADFKAGLAAHQRKDLLTARTRLNRALHAGLSAGDEKIARQRLAELADRTVFSNVILGNDPLVDAYTVRNGDAIGKIAKRHHLNEDFLAQINKLPDKNFIRVGKRLKVVSGPFHATVSKSQHVMHIYLQDVYLRTYQVALGTNGGTPTGRWVVNNHLPNPGWTDPRTGKRWHPDDPKNPIGEFWIGLVGTSGNAVDEFGYGIHGTIEPETIGQDVSLGCIRLTPDDIAMVYKLLVPGQSYVTVEP